jgi:hypothetical protein
MVRHGQALRDDQGRHNRIEEIGEDLLVIATTALFAEAQERTTGHTEAWDLADEIFRETKPHVTRQIRELMWNHDRPVTDVGTKALDGTYGLLSGGIVSRTLQDYRSPEKRPLRAEKQAV